MLQSIDFSPHQSESQSRQHCICHRVEYPFRPLVLYNDKTNLQIPPDRVHFSDSNQYCAAFVLCTRGVAQGIIGSRVEPLLVA